MVSRPHFVNRRAELALLNGALGASSPTLFVLYGRRRVGKTALLQKVSRKRKALFFTADMGSQADQLASFANALAVGLGEPEWAGVSFRGWEQALRICIERAKKERWVLILDEFQHLVTADRSLPSILQRLWDTEISRSQRFLMMEELREPQVHFSICRALARGHGRPNAIAQAAGLIGKGNIASYLSSLRELRFVERRVPATVRNPERSRKGLYRLSDPFLRFWFRFVLPNRSSLEAGDNALLGNAR